MMLKVLNATLALAGVLLVFTLLPLILAVLVLIGIAYALTCRLRRRWLALHAWYQRHYRDELERERHRVEEEARALGALKLPQWPAP